MTDMADAGALGLDPRPLERLVETVEAHIAEGRYPGAEIAIARHGRLALHRRFGRRGWTRRRMRRKARSGCSSRTPR